MAKQAKRPGSRGNGIVQRVPDEPIRPEDPEEAEKARREWSEELSESLTRAARSQHAPSIQVILVPSEDLSDRFESWLVLRLPDGEAPLETRLGKDSYSREEAVAHLIEVFTAIGEKRAVGEPPDPIETARVSSALVRWRTASSGKSE
jgi:hypothetical protein